MAFLMAGAGVPVLAAQEVPTVVDDRVEDGDADVRPELVTEKAEKSGGWQAGVEVSALHDSNIFISSESPVSDVVVRVSPSVAYSRGGENEEEGGFLRFAYRPAGVIYLENGDDNRVDHHASFAAAWRGKLARIAYTGGFQKRGDATADAGRQVDRIEFENVVRAAWSPREKVSLELAAGHSRADYRDGEMIDSDRAFGEVAIRYAYSPKTRLGLAYQYGRLKVDRADGQRAHQVVAGLDWQPRQKIRVELEAGAEYRKFENGSEVNPVVNGRVGWQPGEGTDLYVRAYQREEASSYFAGQNYRVRGFSAGVGQRVGRKWTVRLEGGRETADYQQVSGTGGGDREDRYWFIRPSAEYRINDAVMVELFYRASGNNSTIGDFSHDQHLIGVRLDYQF